MILDRTQWPLVSRARLWTLVLVSLLWPGASASLRAQERPDILFILTDDQTYTAVHSLGGTEIETPNIDRLVARGTTFTHCFNMGSWSGAVCLPSRAMINSGRNLFQIVEPHDTRPAARLDGVTPLWAEHFKSHGYATFGTGKWHNGVEAFTRSFTYGRKILFGGMHNPDRGGHFAPELREHAFAKPGDIEGFSTDIFADAALGFLKSACEDETPFFCYLAFTAPHDPRHVPEKWSDAYDEEKLTVPANFLPEHPFDQGHHKIRDEVLLPFPRTREQIRHELALYYAMISHLDARVGDIVAQLEKAGRLERTLIVFASDHGLAIGRHGLLGKQNQYDHSVRAPLIFAGPGVPKGEKHDDLVYLHQIYATTCELAGLPVPSSVQAGSLVPIMNGEAKGHESIFGAYIDFQRMVRTEQYKLIRYEKIGRRQLFDMQADPLEMKDLSTDEKYADVVETMGAKLLEWQRELKDPLLEQ